MSSNVHGCRIHLLRRLLAGRRQLSCHERVGATGRWATSSDIDRQVVPDDPVPELVTVEVTFHGPAVAAFRDFLADSIEVHDSGRITIADIWEAWAAHWGVDHGDNLIGSISQQDVTMHFRGHFLAPEQVRARVEGAFSAAGPAIA